MIAEALRLIGDQAVKASGVHIVLPPVGSQNDYGVLMPDGKMEWRPTQPVPRNHKVSDVTSLVAFAQEKGMVKGDESYPESVLWYSRTGVVLIVDDKTRRDRVTLPLEFSPQLKRLAALEANDKAGVLSQEAFIRLLRVHLHGCSADGPKLASNASKLKFKKTEDGHAEIGAGKASVGKSLTLEKSGADKFQETVTFVVPVFHGHPWRAEVMCDLDFTPDDNPFTLTPVAGTIETAIRLGETALAVEIGREMAERKLEIPLYYGTP